ncbi:MAG: histidine kinase [Bacteroidales bacterium]|nr:histidine kinase [Bacteroidales bacterium]
MTTKWNNTVFNIVFWLAYFLYAWLTMASIYNEYQRYLINAAVLVPITASAAVFTVHFLFRVLYQRNRKILFWTGLFLSMFVFILIRRSFNYFYTYPLYYPEALETMSFWFLPKLIIEGVNIYLFVGLYSMFYFIKAWYDQERLSHTLKQEKAEAELKLLKSQVQPHFIFNTLNNIYSYAVQKNEKTADLILQLSSFLSYGLYESKPELVPLQKEIDVIRSYIELERIRYGDRLDASINVFDNVDQTLISPLLLLPLVENSFKHGFTSSIDKCWIRLDISCSREELVVKIENSIGEEQEKSESDNGGLGLMNLRRRLEILYPSKHEFRTKIVKDSFLAVLKIKIKRHG